MPDHRPPRAGTWSYLIRADMHPIGDPAVVAQLWSARVVVVRDVDIALPSLGPGHQVARTWVVAATDPFRPSGTTVLACARELLDAAKPRNHGPY
ncbi:hypothetical protein ACFVJ5_04610 [Nocardia sp. NPDC127606]|uniref:hypothetical protein n=1 Tax=Nocardia sp. NPDC127606 TaxID=3345406 RepID=UPI0036394A99